MKKKKSNNEKTLLETELEGSIARSFGKKIQNEGDEAFEIGTMFRVKNAKKKSGGFQSLGLSNPVLKGILRKGYKMTTPIQRKAIPMILEGKDVVGMARTGSGKTATFLVPLFQRLRARCAKAGARALILSPTRELAQQTMKFAKELGHYTDLRTAIVLGGDKMDDQFAAIHENPDILIATPGRFLHIVMEMNLKLSSVEYVVFDEADRLFEMGFRDQLQEILHRLPEHRQTMLFSATLPKLLVDFAKAGLNDPVLIRLDTDSKLSDKLKNIYLLSNSDDKLAILLHLLNTIVDRNEMTVVFLATKHHVDYVQAVLKEAGISSSYVYSSLDQAARKIQVGKFRARKTKVLLVTDVAARGIDIPFLDNVINYNFPSKPKLFVHRVGRVARAGRSGTAYSIVSPDEAAYVLDLHLFMGKPLLLANQTKQDDGVLGKIPQNIIDEESDLIANWHTNSIDLQNMAQVCVNAYKQYLKSRPVASTESSKRVKEILIKSIAIHPLYQEKATNLAEEKAKFLESMKGYRPQNTILEIGSTAKSISSEVMRIKKAYHKKVIDRTREAKLIEVANENKIKDSFKITLPMMGEDEVNRVFPAVSKAEKSFKDSENFLPYRSTDYHAEKGMEIDKSFDRQAASEMFDLTGDDSSLQSSSKNNMIWDRKKKRFVNSSGVEGNKKKIKTESGARIPATYKSDAYKQWKEKTKIDLQDDDGDVSKKKGFRRKGKFANKFRGASKKGPRRELKTKDEILSIRSKREKNRAQHNKKEGGGGGGGKTKRRTLLKRTKKG